MEYVSDSGSFKLIVVDIVAKARFEEAQRDFAKAWKHFRKHQSQWVVPRCRTTHCEREREDDTRIKADASCFFKARRCYFFSKKPWIETVFT